MNNIYKKAIAHIPFSFFSLVFTPHVIIPYYHMISDDEVLHTKHLYPHKNVKQFTNDIEFVAKSFTPIHLMSLLAFVKKSQPLPPKSFLLTFDDGFRELHDIVAPVLLRKGIPAIFFINSNFTDNQNLCYQHKASLIAEYLSNHELSKSTLSKINDILPQNSDQPQLYPLRVMKIKHAEHNLVDEIAGILEIDFNTYLQKHQPYLTSEQIQKLLKQGFTIGAHSIDHPLYADLTLDEQIRQTAESMRFVKEKFNLDYGAFAFPHSDHGVSNTYFHQIETTHLVDISFGTAGTIDDCMPNHFQRFSLEKPLQPARDILAYQFARGLWHKIKDNKIDRP